MKSTVMCLVPIANEPLGGISHRENAGDRTRSASKIHIHPAEPEVFEIDIKPWPTPQFFQVIAAPDSSYRSAHPMVCPASGFVAEQISIEKRDVFALQRDIRERD